MAFSCSCLFFLPGIDVLTWERAEREISWGGIILIVTGLSLGMAIFKTGAAEWIAWVLFGSIGRLHPVLIVFVITIGVSLMKVMFSSNTVTGIIVVPLLIALATTTGIQSRPPGGPRRDNLVPLVHPGHIDSHQCHSLFVRVFLHRRHGEGRNLDDHCLVGLRYRFNILSRLTSQDYLTPEDT